MEAIVTLILFEHSLHDHCGMQSWATNVCSMCCLFIMVSDERYSYVQQQTCDQLDATVCLQNCYTINHKHLHTLRSCKLACASLAMYEKLSVILHSVNGKFSYGANFCINCMSFLYAKMKI